jgi:hypothetical protein
VLIYQPHCGLSTPPFAEENGSTLLTPCILYGIDCFSIVLFGRRNLFSICDFSRPFAFARTERDRDMADLVGAANGFGSWRELCSLPIMQKRVKLNEICTIDSKDKHRIRLSYSSETMASGIVLVCLCSDACMSTKL